MAQVPDEIQKILDETRENRLETLDISRSRTGIQLFKVPDEVSEFTWLKELNISGHYTVQLPDWLANFTKLTSLNISGNQLVQLPAWMGNFIQLTSLDISNNRLRLPAWMGNFIQLTSLDISGNYLELLPNWLANFTKLTSLNIASNDLGQLPDWLANFTKLTSFNIASNNLGKLPAWMGNFIQLTSLDISGNYLELLPDWLANFTKLTSLKIASNDLGQLPDWLANFTQLTSLNISFNGLEELPDWLANFTQLTSLDISVNKLEELPDWLANFTKLASLDISDNQLRQLPDWLVELPKLQQFGVAGNPINYPPPDIIGDSFWVDLIRLRNFYQQVREQGVDKLYEAKLLIVGEPRAGKTTLSNKIENPDFDIINQVDTTQGIAIKQWRFPYDDKTFTVNIWDFGGQEIYKATHRFFLTERSFYILLIDARKEDTDFNYWFEIIDLLSNNSPLIIVVNEKEDISRQLSESQLTNRYENLKEIIPCNLADNRGLDKILRAIQYHMPDLSHVGSELPAIWVKIREALEQDPRDFISMDDFEGICNDHELYKREDQIRLLQYLHDLGICLHFDDFTLKNTIFLKPHWGTEGVYRILDNETVKANWGRFTHSDLADIWNDKRYATMQNELLRLMEKFYLCYKLPHLNEAYIAPQLLPPDIPSYQWDTNNNLRLKYDYGFMPSGIITQFIVAVHRLIENDFLVWRNGVVIKDDGARADIIENARKEEINVHVSGQNKQRLLHNIMYEFDKIHASFVKLKVDRLIPCICNRCTNHESPEFFRYDVLVRAINQRQQVQCQQSFELLDPSHLIADYIPPLQDTKRSEYDDNQKHPHFTFNLDLKQETTVDNKNIDNSKNITTGDINNSNVNLNIDSTIGDIQQNVGNVSNATDETKQELQQQLDELKAELNKLLESNADKEKEASKILERVDEVVKESNDPDAEKEDVQDTGNKLIRAADKVAELAPKVVDISKNVVRLLLLGL